MQVKKKKPLMKKFPHGLCQNWNVVVEVFGEKFLFANYVFVNNKYIQVEKSWMNPS